ncbi:MAG: hypothetical protein J6O01_05310 [Bacteroidales bacterium]|nr:hypothetical protein [Bacteroidales bacterium]
MKRFLLLSMILLAAGAVNAGSLSAQDKQDKPAYATKAGRMDRSQMQIGVYHLRNYARTEAHIKDLADCGVNFVICMDNDRPALDLFQKYGVGAILSGIVPGWWGGMGDNAGTLKDVHPLSEYEECAAKFEDHPAVWGIDIGDEPSCWDFPYYGKVLEKAEEVFPNQFAFINLHPYYAPGPREGGYPVKGALGTSSYEDYIDRYCKNVPADYLSYDFYYLQPAAGVQKAYANLRIVADACLQTGRDMWITCQVNSLDPKAWVSLGQLRFQAFSSFAFGAQCFTWACYTAGWWDNQVVDKDGNKTQQYDKLKTVNAEIHRLGKRYMKYTRKTTTGVGFDGTDMLKGTGVDNVKVYEDGVFAGLTAGCPLLVGQMDARDGGADKALFVFVADDPYDKGAKKHTLRFQAPGREVSILGGDGYVPMKRGADGWVECTVSSNQGLLVEAAK